MRYKEAMRRHYTDRATIRRNKSVKVGHETVMQLQIMHAGLPCRLSQTGLAKNNQTESKNPITYDAMLFCDPDIDIRQGDEIAIVRKNSSRALQYIAGEPFPPYRTHQEIGLSSKGDA